MFSGVQAFGLPLRSCGDRPGTGDQANGCVAWNESAAIVQVAGHFIRHGRRRFMSLYGVRIQSVDDADFFWFTTNADLKPGRYVLGHHRASSRVFLSETIPGLVMQVTPVLMEAEDRGRESLASPGIKEEDRKRLEAEHTQGLLGQLTETSPIWHTNPGWVRRLRPEQ